MAVIKLNCSCDAYMCLLRIMHCSIVMRICVYTYNRLMYHKSHALQDLFHRGHGLETNTSTCFHLMLYQPPLME